uniref:Autophagy-related protein 16 domain-containing protein n=1 Tax=Sphenodon punctatus TaxID=8508 RepID=A0A8D0HNX6_SPHPU
LTQAFEEPALPGVLSPTTGYADIENGCKASLALPSQLAYQIIELSKLVTAKECEAEETQVRLALASGRLSELEAEYRDLTGQAEVLGCRNAALKEGYDTLLEHYWHQEQQQRRAAEEGRELTERLLRKKVEAAKHQNYRNEKIVRAKEARVAKELKKAVKRNVRINVEPEEAKAAELKVPNREQASKPEDCAKPWKRPFR